VHSSDYRASQLASYLPNFPSARTALQGLGTGRIGKESAPSVQLDRSDGRQKLKDKSRQDERETYALR
jgi:hypothetical protein